MSSEEQVIEPAASISRRAFLQVAGLTGGGLAAGAILAACGAAGKSSQSGVTPKSSVNSSLPNRPAALRMLYAGAQADYAAISSVLPRLKSELGVSLVVDNLPYNALEQKTLSELASGSPAHDIYIIDTPWTPTLTHVLEPLSSYMTDTKMNAGVILDPTDFVPKVFYDTTVYNINRPSVHYPDPTSPVDVTAITGRGFEILGLPIQGNALTMAYRKDLFESGTEKAGFKAKYGTDLVVPKTWQDFVKVAQWFTRPAQHLYGTTLMAGVGDWDVDDFKTVLGSFGGNGHMINSHFGIEIDTPVAIEALTFYSDLIQKYKVTPPGTTSASWDTTSSLFSAGTTAMTMNYTPQTLNGNVKGSIGYAMVPKKVVYAPHFGTWQLSVPKALSPDRKPWAYRTVAWLTSAKVQKAMLSHELHPTRNSVFTYAESEASLTKKFSNFYPVLQESLKYGVGRPRVKDYTEVEKPIEIAVNDAASGRFTAAAALKTAAADLERVLNSLGYKATIGR